MLVATKWSLQDALLSCVEMRRRGKARRFLDGLSLDELEYLASFAGACVLEGQEVSRCTRGQIEQSVRRFSAGIRASDDQKMVLLFEYLCRYGAGECPGRAATRT
jgi:hypothetical protein